MNIGAGIQTVTILCAPYPYTSITYWHRANPGPCYHVHWQTNHEMYWTDKQTNWDRNDRLYYMICFHRQKYSAVVIAKYYSWMRFGAVLKLPHKHDDGPGSSQYTAACCSHFRKMRKVKGKNMCTTTPMNHWRRQKIIKNVIEMTAARSQDWYLL